ncbi:MAG: MtnX-like HAD-IB family phosphatase [Nitrospiraceae bacterium]|nr:MtnX-like HAD-IB family phosphatase [Nitrospiraceae bacterium]
MIQREKRRLVTGRMKNGTYFVSIDFDGTVSDVDVTDAVIEKFAGAGWQEAEKLWQSGSIGSRECLTAQMALINSSMASVMAFVDRLSLDPDFKFFVESLCSQSVPFAIVSDGFYPFIQRILENEGLGDIPVFANHLKKGVSGLEPVFPYSNMNCRSGTCKCTVVESISKGLPIIHIGDGRSDFCISEKAAHVFSKAELTGFCEKRQIGHTAFETFADLSESITNMRFRTAGSREMPAWLVREDLEEAWTIND